MKSKAAVLTALCGGVALALLWWTMKPEERPKSGTAEMVRRLAELAEWSAVPENLFDSRPWLAAAEKEAANGGGDEEPQLARQHADQLVIAGRTREAVERLERLERRVDEDATGLPPNFAQRVGKSLGIARLRLAEEQNCITNHNADSCLLPIRNGGIHRIQESGREAIRVYRKLLESDANDLHSRWMLNLAYQTVGEYPGGVPSQWLIPPTAFESAADIGRFRDVASDVGLAGSGIAGGSVLEDFDRDGDLDVMSSSMGLGDQLRYFRNDGNGRFTDRTKESGITGLNGGLNMTHADYDNDGWPDVLVLRGGWFESFGVFPSSLLRNNGDGTFDDVTEAAGLMNSHPTQTAAWGDFDNDGWLDLYIGNEDSPKDDHPSRLFRNRGDGTFVDVTKDCGVAIRAYVKGVAWGDYDNDGRLDLHISILGRRNVLFHNEGPNASGQWRFRNATVEARVGGPRQSFATWFWDYDNDGWQDLFVASFPRMYPPGVAHAAAAESLGIPTEADHPRLYHNERNGTFRNVTEEARVARVEYAMGSNFGDLDNDGFLDFYLGTGAPEFDALVPNRMYRNAEGRYFQDVTTSGGFGHLQKGHAVAFGDIDNDGDQDVYADMGGAFVGDIYRNALFENPGHGNHWVTLKLVGSRSNRSAIGARLRLSVEGPEGVRDVFATVSTGGSFGSSSLQQEIGLGRATRIRELEVRWPIGGAPQVLRDLAVDQAVEIREGEERAIPVEARSFRLGGVAVAKEHHH